MRLNAMLLIVKNLEGKLVNFEFYLAVFKDDAIILSKL
jgi:hypothetical protein